MYLRSVVFTINSFLVDSVPFIVIIITIYLKSYIAELAGPSLLYAEVNYVVNIFSEKIVDLSKNIHGRYAHYQSHLKLSQV